MDENKRSLLPSEFLLMSKATWLGDYNSRRGSLQDPTLRPTEASQSLPSLDSTGQLRPSGTIIAYY